MLASRRETAGASHLNDLLTCTLAALWYGTFRRSRIGSASRWPSDPACFPRGKQDGVTASQPETDATAEQIL